MSKKHAASRGHYSTISWYSTNYWLLNGFLLPELAHSAISDLIRVGRFPSLDAAILAGVQTLLEENCAGASSNGRQMAAPLQPDE